MVIEERSEPVANAAPGASQIKTFKYIKNQLLDRDGQLLGEHRTAKSRHPTQNTIQIV